MQNQIIILIINNLSTDIVNVIDIIYNLFIGNSNCNCITILRQFSRYII